MHQVSANLRKLCQSFFKDSFREYILSAVSFIEAVLVTQSCALVRSYMSGLQQSHTQKVPTAPSIEIQVDNSSTPNSHGSQHMLIHNDKIVGCGSNWQDHDGTSNLDTGGFETSPLKNTEMGDVSPLKDKSTSSGPSTEKQSTEMGDASPLKDKTTGSGPSTEKQDTEMADGSPIKDKTTCSGLSTEQQHTEMVDASPLKDKTTGSGPSREKQDTEMGDASPSKVKADDAPTDQDVDANNKLGTKNDKELHGSSFHKKDACAAGVKKNDGSSNPEVDANKKLPTEKDKKLSVPSIVKQDDASEKGKICQHLVTGSVL